MRLRAVYRILPTGANTIAVNKYHVIIKSVKQSWFLHSQSTRPVLFTISQPVLMPTLSAKQRWNLSLNLLILQTSVNQYCSLQRQSFSSDPYTLVQPDLMLQLSGNLTWYLWINQPDLILTPSFNQYRCLHCQLTSPNTKSVIQPYTIIYSFLILKSVGLQGPYNYPPFVWSKCAY